MSYRPITDFWFLARAKYEGGKKRYGAYLGGFPERARALLGATITDPVLHVCGGLAHLYPYDGGYGPNDARLDLDEAVHPEFLQDAREPFPAGMKDLVTGQIVPWKALLIDPPYSEEDAKQYAPGAEAYPKPNELIANSMKTLQPGQRVGLIHYMLPACPKDAKFVAAVAICCGFNNRLRVYSVFEKRYQKAKKNEAPV
jgi:hypothetical protein